MWFWLEVAVWVIFALNILALVFAIRWALTAKRLYGQMIWDRADAWRMKNEAARVLMEAWRVAGDAIRDAGVDE